MDIFNEHLHSLLLNSSKIFHASKYSRSLEPSISGQGTDERERERVQSERIHEKTNIENQF